MSYLPEFILDINTLTIDQVEASAQATKRVGFVNDDDGNPTVGVVIVSKDSDEYQKAAAKARAAGIRRQLNSRTKIDRKTEEGSMKIDDVMQGTEHELACVVVKDWFGFTAPDAAGMQQPVPFDASKVDHLLKVKPTWRMKISAALEDEDGFLAS